MIRVLIVLSSVIMLYFCYGLYIGQTEIEAFPSEIKRENPPGFHDYRGAINVQTDLSSGTSHPSQVIDEAKKAGLDFLILTDVNQFEQAEPVSGYHDNLLVMSEGEYSFLDSRLLLVGETPSQTPHASSDVNLFLTDLLSQPGNSREALAILAHPFVNGQPTWTGAYPPGLHGLEVLNPKSMGTRVFANSKLDIFLSLVIYPFNSRFAFLRLFREPHEETSLWDKLSAERPFFGFAGANASARAVPLANYSLRFPSYQRALEMVGNHLLLNSELTGNFLKDRQKIYQALRNGSFYFSMDLLGDPKGFIVTVNDKDKQHMMGSKIQFKPGLKLHAKLGHEPTSFYEIVLYKDGQREETINKPELIYEIKSPGVYRIQVRVSPLFPLPDAKKWISWIYSNPFFVSEKMDN